MFQYSMSVSNNNCNWFSAIEKVFEIKIREVSGVVASKRDSSRMTVSVACEDKYMIKAKEIIRSTLIDMYLTVCKRNYLCELIKLPQFKNNESYKILIHTLVAFDREAEEEIIDKHLVINESLALDGFFNFRLCELSERWDEIAVMATSNRAVIKNDESLNELLNFLMSAVAPKIKKISIISNMGIYKVCGKMGECEFEFEILSAIELVLYLINVAPVELTLQGEFIDKNLYKRLVSIFDSNCSNSY